MHSETFSSDLERDAPADAADNEEPHAATAIALVMATNVITVEPFGLAIAPLVADHR